MPLTFLVALLILGALIHRNDSEQTWRARITTRMLAASDRVYDLLDEESRVTEHYRTAHHAADLRRFDRDAAQLPAVIDELGSLAARSGAARGLFPRYRSLTEKVAGLVRDLHVDVFKRDERARKALVSSPQTTATVIAWRAAKSGFDQEVRSTELRWYDANARRNTPYQVGALAACAVGVAVTLATFTLFGLRIVRRLRRLASNAERLSLGEDVEPVTGSDEIGLLDAEYRALTMRLQRTLDEKDEALAAYDREHRVASTLQRALLPQEFPRFPELQIYTSYVSAEGAGAVGGDWYDLFTVGDHVVGISAGDIAGHGLQAATRMAVVRQSIRTAARASVDPATVLRYVNRLVCSDDPNAFASALFATLDLRSGRLLYALAGHPPPIIVAPDADAVTAPGSGTLLGVDPRISYVTREMNLEDDSALIFYTDGLIEHNRDPIRGMAQLLAAARSERASPSANPALGLQNRILAGERPRDDAAVMFLVFTRATEDGGDQREEWSFNARSEDEATRAKRSIFWHLSNYLGGADIATVEIIYGELASNVARHTPGEVRVVVDARPDCVVLQLYDRGKAFNATPRDITDAFAENGRGLFLVNGLARAFSVTRYEGGNCARVELARSSEEHEISLAQSERSLEHT